MSQIKAERTRNLRYKRPALASLGFDSILNELRELSEVCSDVHWFTDGDDETLLNALDGDDEAAFEFRIAFSDLEAKAEQLYGAISDSCIQREFDDCTVALIGNRYRLVGYDMDEEDYFSLTAYDEELAYTESGKRLMRHTKPEMLSTIGQCLGIVISFLDVRQSYDYLKATFDILRDENTSLLQTIKEIDDAYEKANEVHFREWSEECRHFSALIGNLPDKVWLE